MYILGKRLPEILIFSMNFFFFFHLLLLLEIMLNWVFVTRLQFVKWD